MKKIRIVLVDDHAMFRSGVRTLLSLEEDIEVVGEASNGSDAVAIVKERNPDIVLMDLSMPGEGGLSAIEKLCRDKCDVRIIVLTMHRDVARLRFALALGIAGFVVKDSTDVELVRAIREVSKGRTHLDGSLSMQVVQEIMLPESTDKSKLSGVQGQLTSRELEVLKLVAYGFTNREIGERLHISIKTVESYRSRVVEKLGLKRRSELTRFAMELGIVGSRNSPS